VALHPGRGRVVILSEVVLCHCEDGSESGARVWRGVGLTTSCDLWAWVLRKRVGERDECV
jgi:hypothetical protein